MQLKLHDLTHINGLPPHDLFHPACVVTRIIHPAAAASIMHIVLRPRWTRTARHSTRHQLDKHIPARNGLIMRHVRNCWAPSITRINDITEELLRQIIRFDRHFYGMAFGVKVRV